MFHGESKCQAVYGHGGGCRNGAYYSSNGRYLCGVHSRTDATRVLLSKDPNSKAKKTALIEARKKEEEEAASRNRETGVKGQVVLSKLRMMKEPEHMPGFVKVFPNYKHGNRPDGFGCKTLSPKDMGPVEHGQAGLPVALNIENFHQFNKVFPSEVGEDGEPLPIFYETQQAGYVDPVPHRHKIEAKGKNVPAYSMWNGKKMTYFESRQFYCTFYERIATNLDEFKTLKQMLKDGYNLQIIGYDAYDVGDKTLEECYLDVSRPFGHELVLYTLLTCKKSKYQTKSGSKPSSGGFEYPWRKYTTEKF